MGAESTIKCNPQPVRCRQAIKPIIGHLKAEHRMDRCHLKGAQGDRLQAVLCAVGYNIKWLLRMIARKGITCLAMIFLSLQQACSQGRSWRGSDTAQTLSTAKAWMSGRRRPGIHRWLGLDVPVPAVSYTHLTLPTSGLV